MDENLFLELLKKPEGKTIDFKSEAYGFGLQKEVADAKFIKDLLAFCNTVRETTAYIILGVREESNGTNSLLGLSKFDDDAILQQKAMSKISPKPHFSSYRFPHDGKVFGVIEIPVFPYERPLVATLPLKGLVADTVYLRRGSSNSEATFSEINHLQKWLEELKLKTTASDERLQLIKAVTDQKIPLSESLGQCLAYAMANNKNELTAFCHNEITGYEEKTIKGLEPHSYRVLKVPATPYRVTLPDWQHSSADRVISYMSTRDEFRDVFYFYPYHIYEIERTLDSMRLKSTLVSIKYPVKQIFPGIKSNIPEATIYIGPQVMNELHHSIRKQLLTKLTGIQ